MQDRELSSLLGIADRTQQFLECPRDGFLQAFYFVVVFCLYSGFGGVVLDGGAGLKMSCLIRNLVVCDQVLWSWRTWLDEAVTSIEQLYWGETVRSDQNESLSKRRYRTWKLFYSC